MDSTSWLVRTISFVSQLLRHHISQVTEHVSIPLNFSQSEDIAANSIHSVIFPSTFTSLNALGENSTIASSHAATDILKEVKDVPLLYIAAFCSGIGAAGMIWLWVQWRANFVWLLNRIFLPGCLNSFAGLISTLTNVYSQHGGNWSVTAWATAAVTGGVMVITGGLFALYNFWLLEAVKKRHELEMGQWNKGHGYEGGMDKIGRKTHEPFEESGSMV